MLTVTNIVEAPRKRRRRRRTRRRKIRRKEEEKAYEKVEYWTITFTDK
jgi:hypothetical protein